MAYRRPCKKGSFIVHSRYSMIAQSPSLIGQESVIAALEKIANGKIAYGHAFLFVGADTRTVRALAAWYATYIVCHAKQDNIPCGECAGCLSFEHADGVWAYALERGPEERTHSVERIRSIRNFVALKPVTQGKRVVLVDGVESLRGPAANALLKNLEEPGEALQYICTAQNAQAVLPTIRSRTMTIFVQPVQHAMLLRTFVAAGYTKNAVEFAATVYPGQAGRVAEFLEHTEQFADLHQLSRSLAHWQRLPRAQRLALTAATLHGYSETTTQRERVRQALVVTARDRMENTGILRPLLNACLALRTNAQPKNIFDAFALQTP